MPGYEGDRNVVLYPGYKGAADNEPFATFHSHFESCLKKTDIIVFIGFAFRDRHINDILESHFSRRRIEVVVLNPVLPESPPWSPAPIIQVPGKFEEKVNDCLKEIAGPNA